MKENWFKHLVNLCKDKNLRSQRNEYYIKKKVHCFVDDTGYTFAFLPTVFYEPWFCRHVHYPIVEIHWLIFHVCFGEWCEK